MHLPCLDLIDHRSAMALPDLPSGFLICGQMYVKPRHWQQTLPVDSIPNPLPLGVVEAEFNGLISANHLPEMLRLKFHMMKQFLLHLTFYLFWCFGSTGCPLWTRSRQSGRTYRLEPIDMLCFSPSPLRFRTLQIDPKTKSPPFR